MAMDLCCICHELLSDEIQISICRRNHYVHSNCHAQLVASNCRTCPICRADLIVHGLGDTCRMIVKMRDELVVENRRLSDLINCGGGSNIVLCPPNMEMTCVEQEFCIAKIHNFRLKIIIKLMDDDTDGSDRLYEKMIQFITEFCE